MKKDYSFNLLAENLPYKKCVPIALWLLANQVINCSLETGKPVLLDVVKRESQNYIFTIAPKYYQRAETRAPKLERQKNARLALLSLFYLSSRSFTSSGVLLTSVSDIFSCRGVDILNKNYH